jgi:uncharacterized protein (TIGR03067 family)
MRPILASAIFLALAFPLLADEKEDAVKKLNGTYEVVSVIIDGKPDTPDKDDKMTFVFKDGTMTIKAGDMERQNDKAKFTLDPSKKPAQIDFTPEKNDKGTFMGIYQLKETDKGTELSMALAKGPKAERPKDFKGEGKDVMAMTLLRKKEK